MQHWGFAAALIFLFAPGDDEVHEQPKHCAPHDGLLFPEYGYGYGIFPGLYMTYYPTKSTAVVVVNYPPEKRAGQTKTYGTGATGAAGRAAEVQVHEKGISYNEDVTKAIERIHEREPVAELMKEGSARFAMRDYAGAADAFRRAAPLDPENGLPRFLFAHALFALGEYESAAFNCRRGFALTPAWIASGNDLRAAYGDLAAAGADFEEQRVALRSHVSVHPADANARLVLGYVCFFTGDLDAAEAQLAPLLKADPADALARALLDEIDRIRANQKGA